MTPAVPVPVAGPYPSEPEARLDQIAAEVGRPDPDRPSAKHLRMAASPFRFLRGTAGLFYADLAAGRLTLPAGLTAVPLTRVQGDCHIANFGCLTEEGAEGDSVVWALNDFDDACAGHAAWDLLRFAVSLHLAGDLCRGIRAGRHAAGPDPAPRGKAPTRADAGAAVATFLAAYADRCAAMAHDPRQRDDPVHDVPRTHVLARPLKKARRRIVGGRTFASKSTLGKETLAFEGVARFRDRPDRFRRLDPARAAAVADAFRPYVHDAVADVVLRLGAGTGSLDVDRYYLLVGPADATDPDWPRLAAIVEAKQQRPAAPLRHFPDLSPVNRMNPAHLTLDCQRLMQRRADLVLDEVEWEGHHWLVRSRHHARVSMAPEAFLEAADPAGALADYAAACAWVLAQAHARGDRRSTRFERAIAPAIDRDGDTLADAAAAYADQAITDHALWQASLNAGAAR